VDLIIVKPIIEAQKAGEQWSMPQIVALDKGDKGMAAKFCLNLARRHEISRVG